jgi:hypothetical protein
MPEAQMARCEKKSTHPPQKTIGFVLRAARSHEFFEEEREIREARQRRQTFASNSQAKHLYSSRD